MRLWATSPLHGQASSRAHRVLVQDSTSWTDLVGRAHFEAQDRCRACLFPFPCLIPATRCTVLQYLTVEHWYTKKHPVNTPTWFIVGPEYPSPAGNQLYHMWSISVPSRALDDTLPSGVRRGTLFRGRRHFRPRTGLLVYMALHRAFSTSAKTRGGGESGVKRGVSCYAGYQLHNALHHQGLSWRYSVCLYVCVMPVVGRFGMVLETRRCGLMFITGTC